MKAFYLFFKTLECLHPKLKIKNSKFELLRSTDFICYFIIVKDEPSERTDSYLTATMKGKNFHAIARLKLGIQPVQVNDKSAIFSDGHIRPQISVIGAENAFAKFLGFAQRIQKIHYSGTCFKTNLFLIHLKDLDESPK